MFKKNLKKRSINLFLIKICFFNIIWLRRNSSLFKKKSQINKWKLADNKRMKNEKYWKLKKNV